MGNSISGGGGRSIKETRGKSPMFSEGGGKRVEGGAFMAYLLLVGLGVKSKVL